MSSMDNWYKKKEMNDLNFTLREIFHFPKSKVVHDDIYQ